MFVLILFNPIFARQMNTMLCSPTHTAQFRSSQCFRFFCVLQICFSQLHQAQHICEQMRHLFLKPWLGDRFKTWSHPGLGLCVSDMDYDGSGSTLAKTQTKQIGNQKWVIPGHQSAPGGHVLLSQTVWLNQEYWYLKNAQKVVECRRVPKDG